MHVAALALALQVARWPSDTPLLVDGRLDEPYWQTIPASEEFYQVLPLSGLPAPFKTSVRLAIDDHYFYIAVWLEDPPGGMRRSNVSRRDHIPASDDTLTITLDPMGTGVFAQVLQVNPDCSTSDGLYNEASLSTDFSPNFFYTVACQQTDQSWSVEFKIPLQELRFAQDNELPWKMLVQRSLIREQLQTVANAPLPRNPLCLLCQAPTLFRPKGLPDPHFFRMTPYALARRTNRDQFASGLDLKYRLNSKNILDMTLNPDFSQVELDVPQLSANTRFALSSPETRDFFLEGTDILETPLKAVATRAIVQPSWGLKYTQRSEHIDGMIMLGDDRSDHRRLIPGPYRSQYRAVQTRQKLLTSRIKRKWTGHNLGLLATYRSYGDEGYNETISLDGMHFLSDENSLRWQSIFSDTQDSQDETPHTAGQAHFLLFQHKDAIWQSRLELKSFSEAFRSELGFNPRNGYRLGILTNSYHQDLGARHITYSLRLSKKAETSSRPMQDQAVFGAVFSGFAGVDLTLETRPETWERIRVDSSLHHYRQHYFAMSSNPGSILTHVQCDLTWGQRLDVRDDQVRPGRVEGCSARMALGKKIEWNGSYAKELLQQKSWLDHETPVLINRVSRHLLVIPFDTEFSLRYIRQEAHTTRMGDVEKRTETDSWNLTYDKPEIVTLHAGATTADEPAQNSREYYIKISAPLP